MGLGVRCAPCCPPWQVVPSGAAPSASLAYSPWVQGRQSRRREGLTPIIHNLAQCQVEFTGQSVCQVGGGLGSGGNSILG